MGKLIDTKGNEILVDDDVEERFKGYSIYGRMKGKKTKRLYFTVNYPDPATGKLKQQNFQRMIMNTPSHLVVGHRSSYLDLRRCSLENCTQAQNTRFRAPNAGKPGKGPSYHKQSGKFQVRITVNGNVIPLGMVTTEREGHLIYNEAAIEGHGDHAYPNTVGQERLPGVMTVAA